MKKIVFFFIAFSLLLTSCGQDPVKFNDTLIYYVDKAYNQTEGLHSVLTTASSTGDFSSIEPNVTSVVDSLNIYIKELEALKTPKDGVDFKTSVISYMNSLVSAVDSYKTFSNIKENSSQEEIDSITNAVSEKEDEVEKLYEEVQKKQVAFATKNNMDLK